MRNDNHISLNNRKYKKYKFPLCNNFALVISGHSDFEGCVDIRLSRKFDW